VATWIVYPEPVPVEVVLALDVLVVLEVELEVLLVDVVLEVVLDVVLEVVLEVVLDVVLEVVDVVLEVVLVVDVVLDVVLEVVLEVVDPPPMVDALKVSVYEVIESAECSPGLLNSPTAKPISTVEPTANGVLAVGS